MHRTRRSQNSKSSTMTDPKSSTRLSKEDRAIRESIAEEVAVRRAEYDAYLAQEEELNRERQRAAKLKDALRLVVSGTPKKPTSGPHGELVIDSRTWAMRIAKLARLWVERIGLDPLDNGPNVCDGMGHRLARHMFERKACKGASVPELAGWIDWSRGTLEPMGKTAPLHHLCDATGGLVRYFRILNDFCDGTKWNLEAAPGTPAPTVCIAGFPRTPQVLLVGSRQRTVTTEGGTRDVLVLDEVRRTASWHGIDYPLRTTQRVALLKRLGETPGVWVKGHALSDACDGAHVEKLVSSLRKNCAAVGALIESSRSGYRLMPGVEFALSESE